MSFKTQRVHDLEVQKLQNEIRQGHGLRTSKKSKNSNTLRNTSHLGDLSSLKGILAFNPEDGWIRVEPRITFSELCRFTLQHGLVPPVVPEFKTITVGGAIMGAAIESSSHRYGQVSDQILSYELILGNGELIEASPEKNSDLFYGISGSYGTLALLTAVQLRLIPAQPYVRLSYTWQDRPTTAALDDPTADFIEGIVYSPEQTVVIKGELTDKEEASHYRQNHYWSTWFSHHVEKKMPQEESMTLYEYLFRHDRGAFWIGRYILSFPTLFQLFLHLGIPQPLKIPPQPTALWRFLFGWRFASHQLYRLWHHVPNSISEKIFFIHDFYSPDECAEAILDKMMQQIAIFPIWLCPVKGTTTAQFLSPHYGKSQFVNIGLYGIPRSDRSIPDLSAQWEKEILAHEGRKMLYSLTYYTKEIFDKIYETDQYHSLRKKFFAEERFPTLYNKVINK